MNTMPQPTQVKQIELPSGIKYIRIMILIQAIIFALTFLLFIFLIRATIVSSAIVSIASLIFVIPLVLILLTILFLIFRGLGNRKYWAWILSIIIFSITNKNSSFMRFTNSNHHSIQTFQDKLLLHK